MVSVDEDELKVLYQRIENVEKILRIDIDDIYKRLDGLDAYVEHMTYFCSGVGVAIILILYKLFSKGIFTFSFF